VVGDPPAECQVMVGDNQVDASTTYVGTGSAVVSVLPLEGGFQSETSFSAVLRCSHDGASSGISTEGARLVASRVGGLTIVAG
jgi:hypothetical protein